MVRFTMLAVGALVLVALACSGGDDKADDSWPAEYTMPVSDEVEVRFAYPIANGVHGAPVFIRHIASSGVVQVGYDRRVVHIGSSGPDAIAAACAVISDDTVMDAAFARAREIDTLIIKSRPLDPDPCGAYEVVVSTTTPAPAGITDFLAMRYGADWPELYRWRVNDEVEFQFAYPAGTVEWPSPITIWHIPTDRTVSVGSDGRIVFVHESVGSETVAAACAVLANKSLITVAIRKAKEINGPALRREPIEPDPCAALTPPASVPAEWTRQPASEDIHTTPVPPPPLVPTPAPWPAEYTMAVNDDVRIRFASPSGIADYSAAIFVEHPSTGSYVFLDRGGRATHQNFEIDDARAAICTVLSDGPLMEQVMSRSAEITGAFVFRHAPLEPGPCDPDDSSADSLSSVVTPYTNPWPVEFTFVLGSDIEIQFAYPVAIGRYVAKVFVRHLPSASVVGLDSQGLVSYERIHGVDARDSICTVLSDEALISDLISRASRVQIPVIASFPLESTFCENWTSGTTTDERSTTTTITDELRVEVDPDGWNEGYIQNKRGHDGVEIRLAYPAPVLDWAAPVFIRHIKSGASISLDDQGQVIALDDDIPVDVLNALCAVVADPELMGYVIDDVASIDIHWLRGSPLDPDPCELAGYVRPLPTPTPIPMARPWPDEFKWRVDDVEIQFAYPNTGGSDQGTGWSAPIFVRHAPSRSGVSLNIDGRVIFTRDVHADARSAICEVLSNEVLVLEIVQRAKQINAHLSGDGNPIEPDLCAGVE